jgi:hypothetical protein
MMSWLLTYQPVAGLFVPMFLKGRHAGDVANAMATWTAAPTVTRIVAGLTATPARAVTRALPRRPRPTPRPPTGDTPGCPCGTARPDPDRTAPASTTPARPGRRRQHR